MTLYSDMLTFVIDRAAEEATSATDPEQKVQAQAILETAPEIAHKAAAGEGDYGKHLREYASRYSTHPDYRPEWRIPGKA